MKIPEIWRFFAYNGFKQYEGSIMSIYNFMVRGLIAFITIAASAFFAKELQQRRASDTTLPPYYN